MIIFRDILYVKFLERDEGESLADCLGGLRDEACPSLYIAWPRLKDELDFTQADCTAR